MTIKRLVTSVLANGDRVRSAAFDKQSLYQDVIEANNLGSQSIELPAKQANVLDLVMSRLGHVSVNPSNGALSDFIENSYVYAGGLPKSAKGYNVANVDETSGRAFLEELINASRLERQRSLSTLEVDTAISKQYQTGTKLFSLVGDRGVGKSFFLNFLSTKYINLLDESNAIWLRINLVAHHGFDEDLDGWIWAQAAKIIFRYYDTSSEYRSRENKLCGDYYSALLEWVDSDQLRDEVARQSYRDKLVRMHSTFCIKDMDADISPSLCPPAICQQLFRIARERGISFIVALDGFDRLDRDKFHRDRFNVFQNQIKQLFTSKTSEGPVYLLVSRHTTFDMWRGSHPQLLKNGARYCVQSPEYSDILDRRLNVIIDWLEAGPQIGFKEWEQHNALNITTDFMSKMRADFTPELLETELSTMTGNNRAKCQLVQLMFQEFCEKKQGLGYRLVEHMVKAGFLYPPILYFYEKDGQTISATSSPDYIYDSRFLPILARPAIPSSRSDPSVFSSEEYTDNCVLLCIRIIQILSVWENLQRNDTTLEDLSIIEVSEMCHNLFQYSESSVQNSIYELECFEVIFVDRRSAYGQDAPTDCVRLLPKARHLVDRFLHDVAYLNFCGMRMLVTQDFCRDFDLLKASSLRLGVQQGEKSTELTKTWVKNKVRNAVVAASIMVSVNKSQKEKLNEKRYQKLPARFREKVTYTNLTSIFKFTDDWVREISRELNNISNSTKDSLFVGDGVLNELEQVSKTVLALPKVN